MSLNFIKGFSTSISMFSILPSKAFWEEQYLKWVLPTLGLVGLVVGLLWYFIGSLILSLPINTEFQAFLLFLTAPVVTGFIHMDGLIDTSDSIFSRAPLEKKREILKDPNAGSFGVISVVLYFFIGYVAGINVIENTNNFELLAFMPFIARFITSIYLLTKPTYSKNGFAETFRKDVAKDQKIFMVLIYSAVIIFGTFFYGVDILIIIFIVGAVGIIIGEFVTKELEGISGDLCGFIIATCELAGFVLLGFF